MNTSDNDYIFSMFFIRNNKIVLLCFGIIFILSLLFIPRIKAVYNFQDFLVENDPELKFYNEFSKEFDSDNNVLLIGIGNKESIYQSGFLSELKHFTQACNRLQFVENAYSLATLKDYVKSPLGLISLPFIHIEDPKRYYSDSAKIVKDERLTGWLISENSKTVTVIINTKNNLEEDQRGTLITELDALIRQYSFENVHVAGNINTEIRYIRLIDNELSLNMILCSLVVIICLIFSFRSFPGVIIPLITMAAATTIFFGGLGFFNRNFNILSTLFPTILLIVGISDLIHYLTKYHFCIGKNIIRNVAIKITTKELAVTLLITSLTTAIGFFSLTTASIKPIRDFGIEAGIGVLLTFVITILLIPAILKNIKTERFVLKQKKLINWEPALNRIFLVSILYKKEVIIVTVILIFISLFGILKIDSNNYILGNFSNNSSIRKDFIFFEDNLSGVRSFKMAILPQKSRAINDLEILTEIEKFHNYLSTIPDIGVVFSPSTTYKTLNKIYHGGSSIEFRLPKTQKKVEWLDKTFFSLFNEQQFKFINPEKDMGLISAQIKDIGSDEINILNIKIDNWIKENINTNIIEFRHTGFSYLSDKSNKSLKHNMLISLIIAFILVSSIMALLFKNIKFLIISLIPNIVPLIVAGGIMGFAGIVLNASTAIVFTIGFVIAVDDSIHFLSKFKIEFDKTRNYNDAIRITINETGKAIIITSAILFFGFLVLLHSDLKGVFSQGVLFCSMVISAMFADLFLLPVLLRKFLINKR